MHDTDRPERQTHRQTHRRTNEKGQKVKYLLQEEIFGPILPIVNVESAEEAVDIINRLDIKTDVMLVCSFIDRLV